MMQSVKDERSVPDLLSDLIREVGEMFRKEGALARAEVRQSVNNVTTGGETILAGGVALMVGLFVAAQALIVALANVIGAGWAATLVALGLLLVGGALVAKGKSDIENASIVPERALQQARRDADMVREKV